MMINFIKNRVILLMLFSLIIGCSGLEKSQRYNDNYQRLYEMWKLEELTNTLKIEKNEKLREYYLNLANERTVERDEFYKFNEKLKNDLQLNNYEEVEKNLDLGIKKYIFVKYLRSIDFSRISIFISKGNFYKNSAKSTMAMNYGTHTIYFDVEYLVKNGKWKIIKISEKRG